MQIGPFQDPFIARFSLVLQQGLASVQILLNNAVLEEPLSKATQPAR